MQDILNKLIEANIPSPRLEARMIMESASNKEEALSIAAKRVEGYPLDKLLGKKAFYKHSFFVNEDVLSPRPDTEVLVEKAVEIIQDKSFKVLDLGTGSGCIILSILADCKNSRGVAVDASQKALNTAKNNAEALQLSNRVEFVNANWFSDDIKGQYDVIVSNPPYIPSQDILDLQKEVKDHDPILALDGGEDGYDSYRKIAEISQSLLNAEGYILLEVGIHQAEDVANIFSQQGFQLQEIVKDLSQIDRCVILKKSM